MRHVFIAALVAVIAWVAASSSALAQRDYFAEELPELETDRDAFTPATSTVVAGYTVVESSYSFIDNRAVAETHSFPELLFRHGITDQIELRLGWNYEV